MKDSGNKSAPKNKFLGEKNCEWIGEIPDNWKIGKVKHGFNRNKEKSTETNPVVLSLTRAGVKIRDISTNEGQLPASYEGYNIVRPNDLLLNPMDLISGANCSISYVSGVISPSYMNLQAKKGFDPRYYDYFFKTQYWSFALFIHGKGVSFDNRWTLNEGTLRNYYIPIPPLDEQKKIADYLDDRCSKIDEIITGTTASIEDYKKLKQAIITEAVTKGLNKDVPSNNLVLDWCNTGIRDDWQISQIRYLFKLRSEKNYKPLKEVNLISLYTDKGVIQHSDLEQTTGNRAVTADGYKLVYPDDIVVNIILCWMGAIGRSEYQGVTSPAYDVYEPIDKNNVCSRYYHYLFRTNNFAGKCYTLGRGIMMMRWRTYSSEFRSIKVPVPPLSEQKEIANYLDKKVKNIDDIINEKTGLIEDLKAYKKSLIYEVVTGKKRI